MTQLRNLRPALNSLKHFELLYTIDAPRKRRVQRTAPRKKKKPNINKARELPKDLLKGLTREQLEALLKGLQDA